MLRASILPIALFVACVSNAQNNPVEKPLRVDAYFRKTFVFQGTGPDALACGPVLGVAPNKSLVCTWIGGGRAEPKPENKAMVSTSKTGEIWSTPVPALARPSTILDFYTMGTKFCGIGFEFDPESSYTVKRPFRVYSDDNGSTWSAPEYLAISRKNVAIESHIVLSNGDWLFPAYFMELRDKPLEGGTRREYTHTIGCGVLISTDKGQSFLMDSAGEITFFGSIDNRPLGLHEPRITQLSTGRVVMLMRANFDDQLWQATSDDNGRTWSNAEEISIPNPSAKVWLGKLDGGVEGGMIGLALNPATKSRDPLELWLSTDDMKAWQYSFPLDSYEAYRSLTVPGGRHDPEAGWGKGGAWPGNLSYPFVLERNGVLYIVYDVARRDVVLLRGPAVE
jgi:hypothetical protein